MSELVVMAFDDMFKADEVRLTLLKLQLAHLIDLEDSVVAVKKADGTIKLHQMHHMSTAESGQGGFWGTLMGALFVSPKLGTAVGAGAASVSGALSDVGIADAFAEELTATLQPGSSALFILVQKVDPGRVLNELKGFGGKVLQTSLDKAAEARLQAALDASRTSSDA